MLQEVDKVNDLGESSPWLGGERALQKTGRGRDRPQFLDEQQYLDLVVEGWRCNDE